MKRLLGPLLVLALLGLPGSAAIAGPDAVGPTAPAAKVAAPAAAGVEVVVVGDVSCPGSAPVTATSCQQAATARIARKQKPARVIAVGDLQYPRGSYADFLSGYDRSWGSLRAVTLPVPGNHEYQTRGAAGYYRYFANRQPGAPGYYRRVVNGWQLYLLNSNCDKIDCRAQQAWLDRELAANPSRCAAIVTHHPRFSSGGEHGSSAAMTPFWRIAYRHGVDVALSGHDHDYERFAKLGPTGARDSAGLRQFVSGLGGRSLREGGPRVPGSQKFLGRPFGVLSMTLRPTGYSWRYLGIGGKVLDSGTSSCH